MPRTPCSQGWRLPALACVALVALAGAGAGAEEVAGKPAQAVVGKMEAERLVLAGKKAMQEASSDASRSVVAEVAFSKALAYFEAQGDTAAVCDLEADIFWCRKHMPPADVAALAAGRHDGADAAALAKADAVVAKVVPQEEAAAYLERAARFAAEHPGDFEQISIHYFEVAERFVGTPVSLQAQKLSNEAQQRMQKDAGALDRATVFSKPDAPANGKRAPQPAPDEVKAAVLAVRKLYKDDYGQGRSEQKRRLVPKLLDKAQGSSDEPAIQYALLSEVIDLAGSLADWDSVHRACGLMAAHFTGSEAKARQQEVFARWRSNPTVQAILKLLDQPDDAEANLVAGRYFACEAQNWQIGTPLLARGSDADFKRGAEQELGRPTAGPAQVELADRWYDLARKANGAARQGLLTRAYSWYGQAWPGLSGITRTRVAKRFEELATQLPPEVVGLVPSRAYQLTWDRYKTAITVKSSIPGKSVVKVVTQMKDGKPLVSYDAIAINQPDGVLFIDGSNGTATMEGPDKAYRPDSFTIAPKGTMEGFDISGEHHSGTWVIVPP